MSMAIIRNWANATNVIDASVSHSKIDCPNISVDTQTKEGLISHHQILLEDCMKGHTKYVR